MVHAQRQFVDIFESFPLKCQHVIDLIGQVYKNEEDALESKLTPEQRLIFHQQRSDPAMEELHQWASEHIDQRLVEPNSVLGKAITYLQRHWEPLTLFLRQPGAPIDNNACEQALKKEILHRKNSMFYKTSIGARLGDLFMSIFYTCQLNKITPLPLHEHGLRTTCRGCGQPRRVAPLELPAGCLNDFLSRARPRAIGVLTPSLSGVELLVDPQPSAHS